MIVKALLDLVYTLFELFTRSINIPGMPDGVRDMIASYLDYVQFGLALLANWTDLRYLLILFGIIVAVDAGVLIYLLVMWILRKIPVISVS